MIMRTRERFLEVARTVNFKVYPASHLLLGVACSHVEAGTEIPPEIEDDIVTMLYHESPHIRSLFKDALFHSSKKPIAHLIESTVAERLIGAEPPSNDTAKKIDKVARAICREHCAFYGDPPCWSVTGEKWPNPHCDEPGCHAFSMAAIDAMRAPEDE